MAVPLSNETRSSILFREMDEKWLKTIAKLDCTTCFFAFVEWLLSFDADCLRSWTLYKILILLDSGVDAHERHTWSV